MITKKTKSVIFLVVTCSTLQGCAFAVPSSYVSPKEVTLATAMKQTACGLSIFNNELAKMDFDPGLVNDQVDVTMNLTASATGTGTLVLDTKTAEPVAFFAPIGVKYTDETVVKGERGNQIKISMKNLYTAGLNDPGKKAIGRDGPRLGLGPRVMSPRDLPCEAAQEISNGAVTGAENSAHQAKQKPKPKTKPTSYVLDCSRYGRPNRLIKIPASSLTKNDQERACTGIEPLIRPGGDIF
ncbi:hypothetical protein HFO05_07195 [Rhizobium laguerreae]|uniref:hypothetical protein n=1 Tax=Rhizobium laguerreae TaxID=1076926 RepID=UPI001C91E29B|nr:hypothetical protein [Rhizobium laguerreae]MBY3268397.1 hypothetical protein [Rhizobium laguerreae]